MDNLSLIEARQIALAAQGFDRPRTPGKVGTQHLRRVIRQLGLVQVDFVNVLVPAHYVVLFSRLGPYDRSLLDDLVYRSGHFTEQWGHEASILPVETWPLLRPRMQTHRPRPWGFEKFLDENVDYVCRVLDAVRERGPLAADDLLDLEGAAGVDRGQFGRIPGAWVGTIQRAVLEAHFGRGLLASAGRRPNFVRLYDLAERLIPAEHHQRQVAQEDADRELVSIAARAYGIATAADLADYYRMPITQARPRVMELVEAGELREAKVQGWRDPAYLHREAPHPARSRGKAAVAALLSPFDPVVWFRPRVERLFQFDYRIEIYVPQAKRKWGYYVLPFLLGDCLAARVDLKADRPGRRLMVLAAYLEPHAKPGEVAEAMAQELRTVASWLGLDAVDVARKGNLARSLASALRS